MNIWLRNGSSGGASIWFSAVLVPYGLGHQLVFHSPLSLELAGWHSCVLVNPLSFKSQLCSLLSHKNLNSENSILLVSRWRRRQIRSKQDDCVELFKLYNPVWNCSGDLLRSPENRDFFTCRASGSKWKLSISFGILLVLAKEIHQ